MSLALKNKANQIRSTDPIVAAALVQASDDIDRLQNLLALLSGFNRDQLGQLSIDTLAIRSLTSRAEFEDPPDIQNVTAAGYRIIVLGRWNRLNNTSGGAVTLTSAPTIADGKNGQVIELLNISANNIIVQDQGTLAASNLRLSANTITLGTRDSLTLRFSSDVGDWVQRGFTNVL